MSSFVVQFLLKTERFQEDVLNKRFETYRKMYNSLVTITQNRYKEMTKTTKYRQLLSKLKLYNLEVERLKGQENLSSIAI